MSEKEEKKYETVIMQDPQKPRTLELWVLTEEFHDFKSLVSWVHKVEMAHKIVDTETQKILKDKMPAPKIKKEKKVTENP